MACERWRARLVAHLYDESEPDEAREVESHVASCASCRAALDDLDGARRALRDAAPDIPEPRPLVLVAPVRGPFGRAAAWTAAIASAAAVLAIGVAIGVAISNGRSGSGPGIDESVMRSALEAQERRIERFVDDRLSETASTTVDPVTIDDLDQAIATLRSAIDRGRREDVDFILAEIAAAEMRSGAALDATRERLRYYALAENPGATEW